MECNYRSRGDALIKSINSILWYSLNVFYPTSILLSSYWNPCKARRLWQWHGCRSEEDMVVGSFQLLNPHLYYSSGIVDKVNAFTVFSFFFIFYTYSRIFDESFNVDKSAVPVNKLSAKDAKSSPNFVRRDYINNGVPCAWFKCDAFFSNIIFSITTGSSIIISGNFW